LALDACTLTISPSEVAIVFNIVTGEISLPYTTGHYLILPVVDHVTRYPLTQQVYVISDDPDVADSPVLHTSTLDHVEVILSFNIYYRIQPLKTRQLFLDWDIRYHDHFVYPMVSLQMTDAISHLWSISLIDNRHTSLLETWSEELLFNRFQTMGLILDNVEITELILKTVPPD
jgi:hypothetical protein